MTHKLDRNASTPLYAQLEEILRYNITNGIWKPDQRIPSENELNKIYSLSRMTVRSVVTQLVHDGLLYRVQGKGTFVARPKISAHSPAYKGVREQLEGMGYETVTKLLKIEKTADPNIRAILRLQPNESVFAIDRIRLIKDEPISIHRSYVPCALAPELMQYDVENEQLCAILEKNFGLKMKFVEESLETVSAMSSEAELLHVKRGYPLLLLEDVIYDENRCPFEYAKIIFRGDRIKLHFDYDA